MGALAGALALASASGSRAQTTPVPEMTVEIFNNSSNHNIYPVLSTGTSTVGKWLQAAFGVRKADLAANPYPKLNQFRLYINPTGDGIPPGGHVIIKLPLYTQLVPTRQVNPKETDQYIDWWGGGRIEIFDAPAAEHQPPLALRDAYTGVSRPDQVKVRPIAAAVLPTCDSCQPFTIFRDPSGFKHNEPSQLTEYTLGAINQAKDPYELNDHNVDFDVSYVDDAYLPAVMEPHGNRQIGYVGTPLPIDTFRNALTAFVAPGAPYRGWPQYIDNQGQTILKIPSALHILGGDPDLTPPPWRPINQMTRLWRDCMSGARTDEICTGIHAVNDLFQANYQSYRANFKSFGCTGQPVRLNEATLLRHVYGWGPFNENCNSATFNLLENTPGYAARNHQAYQVVKDQFDDLQYWPTGEFDPYVVLIHGEDYINAPNVYAYSVDDAVGNMQADGDGLIIAVGGTRGMPNPDPATPPIHVSFGYSSKDAVRFVKYGICTDPPDRRVDPDFPSFDISITSIGQCPLTFVDNNGHNYTFTIESQPPYPPVPRWTPRTHKPINCSGNADPVGKTWCEHEGGVFAYTKAGVKRDEYFVITAAPQQPPP